ncbi:c-type cytochrome biogenesis protein CcmI [Aliiroseovarius subalbicans]|uniref:c-type cytochrome biogenesis protein CcmI n=1 Tax=Aliiroseovarius subalbicans TaxID=2925840 RepID=UPI001F5A2A40|nr:c-type cytochrome biogenesis protein CcmI [Aliiroseovarius subalbicans]MCI2398696.1 c-type cytochrome biogenesis protein CcmI [Aliiroseovarius subalbicans]
MGFWLIAGLIALVIVGVLIAVLMRKGADGGDAAAAYDMQVYRDQLKELDRDVARGTVTEGEAERTRVEISRRLLEADRKAQAGSGSGEAPSGLTKAVAAVSVALVLGGGYWLYDDLGAPGYPDMGLKARKAAARETRETRPSQAALEAKQPPWAGPPPEAPADYVSLVERLRVAVKENPEDMQGLTLLTSHEAALGNYRAAAVSAGHLAALKGDTATADDHTKHADLLVLAAGGLVSPEAETALEAALSINPKDAIARYYSGLLFSQTGRPDLAFHLWKQLLEEGPGTAPWIGPIRAQIEFLAAAAGEDYTPPADTAPAMPGLSGPTAEDIENAGDMTPEERQEMIRGMVSRLMERMAVEGGPASDWARLVRALGVLGDTDRAGAVYEEALGVFEGHPQDLALIREAGQAAGVAN